MIHLRILGSAEIRKADGELEHSFLAGSKRLALLTYLVLSQSRGFLRRDQLLPLFWPHQGQKSARNSLSNMLYHIRKSLGSNLLVTRGTEELKIEMNSVWCDAVAFEQALKDGKPDRAIELYSGNLLEGFHASNISPDMEQWLDHERERIRSGFLDVLETLAIRAEENGKFDEAAKLWKKRTFEDPFDTRVAKKLARTLAASGQHSEAIRRAKEHSSFLEKELGVEYSETLRKLTEGLEELRSKASHSLRKIEFNDYASSVAVLPFEELGTHSEISNFAIGLHHDLLTRLSGVARLKVISRTSVLRFKQSGSSIREIANELGVDTVIEGAIQQSGEHLRLHVQVIEAKNDGHKIAETYDRKLTSKNLFDLQSELAQKITSSLQTYLSPKEKERISEWTPTENMEAYRYYIKGRRKLDQRTETTMRNSLDFFNCAVELDPEYALAWVGIADALILLFDYGHESPENTLDEASVAIEKALNLDPNLAEAHASMGLLHSNRHEGPDAIRELLIATELQPNYAEAHNWLSWNYQLLGKAGNALKSAKRAVEQNPLSPEAVSNLSVSYLYNGYLDEALSEAQRAVDLQPEWPTPLFYKSLALYHLGRQDEACDVLKNLTVPWAGAGPLATTALCHSLSGDTKKARELQKHFKKTGHLFAAGLIHASFDEYEEAVDCFLKVEQWEDWPTLAIYHLYPVELNTIRDGEEFSQILKIVKKSRGQIPSPVMPSINEPNEKSIAVLPFEEIGQNRKMSDFANGLHYDLLTRLAGVSGFKVISRSSVLRYRDSQANIQEISEDLGVNFIVEGAIQASGGHMRLNVQLIDAESDRHQSAITYNSKLNRETIFDVQTELAEKITNRLKRELSPNEKKLVLNKPTENLEAYLLYTQGRTYLNQRTERSLSRAVLCFQDALKYDEKYAEALAGLAETLLLIEWYGYEAIDTKFSAIQAASKALSLNPDLAEAHTSMGIINSSRQNGPDAIRELETAVNIQPSNAEAYNWLGWMRMIIGRLDEAIEPALKSVKLDPHSTYTRTYLGSVLLANGEYQKALEETKLARTIQPEFGIPYYLEGLALFHLQKYDEAGFVIQEALKLLNPQASLSENDIQFLMALINYINGETDKVEEFQKSVVSDENYIISGLLHACMNRPDQAFKAFEKTEKWGPFPTAVFRYLFPEFLGSLREDARYSSVIQKVNRSWKLID